MSHDYPIKKATQKLSIGEKQSIAARLIQEAIFHLDENSIRSQLNELSVFGKRSESFSVDDWVSYWFSNFGCDLAA